MTAARMAQSLITGVLFALALCFGLLAFGAAWYWAVACAFWASLGVGYSLCMWGPE